MKNYFTIEEVIEITGKSQTTIYRYIKNGRLKTTRMERQGKPSHSVTRKDLEEFLGYELKDHDKPLENENTTDKPLKDHDKPLTEETLMNTMELFFTTKQSQLMKPMEEQALYRLGILENEVKHLHAEKETLRQENEDLKNSIKALPDKTAVEAKDYKILSLEEENETLKKQMELLPGKPEEIKDIFLQNAENLKFLQEELSSSTALAEMKIEKLREQAEQEKAEALKAMSLAAEKEKMELIEAWKKKVDEVFSRPWWKFW